jgi:hypothetical protein
VSITAFPSSGRLGPGAAPAFQSNVLGAGDPYRCDVTLRDGSGNDVLYSSALGATGLFITVYLGVEWDYVAPTYTIQPMIQVAGLADGDAIQFRVQFYDRLNHNTDTATLTGFTWDAQSWGLNLAFLTQQGGGGHDPMLDLILASVRKPFA